MWKVFYTVDVPFRTKSLSCCIRLCVEDCQANFIYIVATQQSLFLSKIYCSTPKAAQLKHRLSFYQERTNRHSKVTSLRRITHTAIKSKRTAPPVLLQMLSLSTEMIDLSWIHNFIPLLDRLIMHF